MYETKWRKVDGILGEAGKAIRDENPQDLS